MEREKQMVLRANRLMRVFSVRLLRSIRWVNVFLVQRVSLGAPPWRNSPSHRW